MTATARPAVDVLHDLGALGPGDIVPADIRLIEVLWEPAAAAAAAGERAALGEDGALSGRLFFHRGDDSGFRAAPFTGADTRDGR
ncbi:hypothetical protein [Frankia gtarii]|uniref:hypothetical protein n=1 Tax=Frankia gtarii TaxID=2950102 RepID=UPI0021C071A0|nr:hypothetical protein [Frankia gtarii]